MTPYRNLPQNTRCLPAPSRDCLGALPKNTRQHRSERGVWLGLLGVVVIPLSLGIAAGCSGLFTPARTARIEQAGIDAAVCVLQHENEAPTSILAACSGVVVEDVLRIVSAHKAAAAKEKAAVAPSCSGSSMKVIAPMVKQ